MAEKEASDYQIDKTDEQILGFLIENARMPYTEIAKKIFVSPGTVHVRMKKMEKMGLVQNPQLSVNYAKLGYDITAFLGIYLTQSSVYETALGQLRQIPEIVGLHYTTGNYSMFAKIHCKDTNHLREVLHDKIQAVEGIQRTETLISLEESIDRPLRFWDRSK